MAAIKKEDATMTSQEMLDRSSSWTLACDNALLNRLKVLSENLTRNSQEITKECDNLSKDISHLDYKLRNVTNQFLMMSNTQFVENRVEEFEEYSSSVLSPNPNTSVSFKTKSEKEAELMSKMKQAIQLGLKACDRKRQERDEAGGLNKISVKRPYLIGSPKFFSKIIKPPVTFTMPPPSVPVFPVPESNPGEDHRQNNIIDNDNRHIGKGLHAPSPTISDRSSDLGKPSSSAGASRENVPRSVTDELNKIYGMFSPPPNADDDSDDDFRPNASAGRIFEDDDDDLFGEKELFPPAKKNTDFFSRSNPSQLPAPPVFTVPPPVNPVPQSQSALSNNSSRARTLVGPSPKSNDIPNMNSEAEADVSSKKETSRNDVLPEADVASAARSKLLPGAVSMFGRMPPPDFHNDKLQAAPTAKPVPTSSLPSKQNANLTETSSKQPAALGRRDSGSISSHQSKQENVNTKRNTTSQQRIAVSSAPPKRTDSISRGSLGSGDLQRKTNKVPASSLFADDSSDEDIFKSSQNKKQPQNNLQQRHSRTIENIQQPPPPTSTINKSLGANTNFLPPAKPIVQKQPVKKSIFDDSESDDGLFASKPSSSSSFTKKENAHQYLDLFKYEPKPKPSVVPVPKQTKSSSLFGDDSDCDTELFGNKKTVRREPDPKPTSKGSVGIPEVPVKVSVPKVPVQVPVPEVPVKVSVPKVPVQVPVPEVPVQVSIAQVPVQVVKKLGLKMDSGPDHDSIEEDEDIFKESLHNPAGEMDSISKSLLNINNIHHDSQSSNDEKKTNESSKSLSSNEPEPTSKVEEPRKKESGKANPVKQSIFDDSDTDDDLFSSKVTVKINKTIKSSSDVNVNTKKEQLPSKAIAKKKPVSLFGDESDSDNDIFSSSKAKNKNREIKTSEKKPVNVSSDVIRRTSETTWADSPVDTPETKPATKTKVDEIPDTDDKEKESCKDDIKNDLTKSTKAVGSKISEKIKAMQSLKLDAPNEDKEMCDLPKKNKISEKIRAMQSPKSEDAGNNKDEGDLPPKRKISEKILAMQSPKSPDADSNEDKGEEDLPPKRSIKSNVSVKNLALNLNINPLALKVGAKPPKPGGSNPSTPDKETNDVPTSPGNDNSLSTSTSATTTSTTADDTTTEDTTTRSTSASPLNELGIEDILYDKINNKDGAENDIQASDEPVASSSSTFIKNDGGDHLIEIIKARARIQQKRRPPSKRFLKSLAIHEEPEESEEESGEVNSEVNAFDEEEQPSESETSNST